MKNIKKIITLFFFLAYILSEAQELPPVENFSPKDYNAENQNWGISESKDKIIYVANDSGLLEFNGAKWKLYLSPNNTIIRSVNAIDDRVYTGCYMEFGYWKKNEFGNLDYYSLSEKVAEPLIEEDFWNIIKLDNWVLFQSLNRIYIFDTVSETFNIIKSDTQLPKVFKVDGSIYYQKLEDGVYKIENGNSVLISNHPILQKNILVNIFSIDKKILFHTQNKGFYFLTESTLTKWNIEASEFNSFSSLKLKNEKIVIGTISKGIFILSKKGNILSQINQGNGLNNNTVLSIFEDSNHNLWLGLDNGISVVNLESPFKVYNDTHGNLGTVYTSEIFNENLYIGTNQGLFYKKFNTKDDFEFIEGTNGQVWCLNIFDNTLFCGHNSGTFVVNENKATLISDVMGTWDIKPIEQDKNLLLQGNYNGLNVLEKTNNKWQFRNKVEGFDISSRFFEIISNNRVFVSHEYKGVFKINIDTEFTKVLDYKIDKSAPNSLKSSLVTYNNEMFYASKQGIFRYNITQQKFVKDSIVSANLFDNEAYVSGKLIVDNKSNKLWGFTNKSVIYFSPGKLNTNLKATKISFPASLRRNITGYESITHLKDQYYLFGTTHGFVQIDLNKLSVKDYEISINCIEKSILNREKTPISLSNNSELEFKENNIYYSYSVPVNDKYTEVNYRYKLKGHNDDWSNWSSNSEVSFENLPSGEYTFNVMAQTGNSLSTNTASHNFKINKPWYLSNLMIAVYALLILGIFYLVHTLNKRYYKKQKQRLLEKKYREFTVSQLENDKVIMKLKNEKLKNDVQSKTRELSASTMSIVRKNELLNAIKDELSVFKDSDQIKPVIKIINKNLTNKGDWKIFQEAFNNADRDFLKRIKDVHSNLTPNDLRLCAYLRLNLSSKEIAPLLSISPRSVEIKRYRLRKKMELPHEKSLVEYILDI